MENNPIDNNKDQTADAEEEIFCGEPIARDRNGVEAMLFGFLGATILLVFFTHIPFVVMKMISSMATASRLFIDGNSYESGETLFKVIVASIELMLHAYLISRSIRLLRGQYWSKPNRAGKLVFLPFIWPTIIVLFFICLALISVYISVWLVVSFDA